MNSSGSKPKAGSPIGKSRKRVKSLKPVFQRNRLYDTPRAARYNILVNKQVLAEVQVEVFNDVSDLLVHAYLHVPSHDHEMQYKFRIPKEGPLP